MNYLPKVDFHMYKMRIKVVRRGLNETCKAPSAGPDPPSGVTVIGVGFP